MVKKTLWPFFKARIWPIVAEIVFHCVFEFVLMVLFPGVPHWIWLLITAIFYVGKLVKKYKP